MTTPLPWGGRLALLLLLPASLLPLLFAGQQPSPHIPSPRFHDWTTRHAVYTQFATSQALEAARNDPRATFRWRELEEHQQLQREIARFPQPELRSFLEFPGRRGPRRFPIHDTSAFQRDWSISLGAAGTANSMYPAKFSFDTTAAPNCANDFVVFPVNAPGGSAQPNIVAFNNLYTGTGSGFCNDRTVPSGHSDSKTAATVLWSYNVNKIGGAVATSPEISFDSTGSKIAFVECAAGKPAHFHVLAWKSGDGQTASLQNALVPLAITTFTDPLAPAANSGTASDLALGSSTSGNDTLSSPYIDYANDQAYVGNDIGVLYRIKNVFCATASCANAAPTLDATWGTAGALTIGGTCTGKLTAPVLDFVNATVYVGCSDGKLYAIPQAGGTIKSLVVGDGTSAKTFGGIVDPPIVDGFYGFIYAVSGSASNGAKGVLVQAKADFSSSVVVPIGAGNQCNLHSPALGNAYYTSPATSGATIFVGGVTGTVGSCLANSATGGSSVLYGATFGSNGVLNAGAPTHQLVSAAAVGSEYAPIGEFYNANIGTGQDTLFVSLLRAEGTANGTGYTNLYSFDVTTGWLTSVQSSITEGLGASGMIFDNAANTSNFAQASSVYFNALNEDSGCTSPQTGANTGGCAVKVTQSGLQ